MTTQEAINLVLSNPKIAQESAVYKANKASYESEKNSLQNNVNSAQSKLDQFYKEVWNKTQAHDDNQQKMLESLSKALNDAKSAYASMEKKWGPSFVGQKASLPGSSFGISTPAGKTLTTAEKQAQNPLYNPLYDPRSTEYQSNLKIISNPNQKPATPTPQIQNPTPSLPIPNVQLPSTIPPQVNKPAGIDTSNLLNAVQNQNQINTPSNPLIRLPEQFQQNQNAAPSIYPPTANQGIKMPSIGKNAGFNTNWSDLFSVANNRFTR